MENIETLLNRLHGDPDRYTDFFRKTNYHDLDYDTVVALLRDCMSWPTAAKFRMKYSIVTFNGLCKILMSHKDDYIDDCGEDIILQWVWRNRNYYADSVEYSTKANAARMYFQLSHQYKDDPAWAAPLNQIATMITKAVDNKLR